MYALNAKKCFSLCQTSPPPPSQSPPPHRPPHHPHPHPRTSYVPCEEEGIRTNMIDRLKGDSSRLCGRGHWAGTRGRGGVLYSLVHNEWVSERGGAPYWLLTLHLSCPALVLSCICPVLPPSCSASYSLTCPACVLCTADLNLNGVFTHTIFLSLFYQN